VRSRTHLLYGMFLVLALLAALLAISSVLLWVVFPRGFFPERAVWVEIHKWGGLALSATVVVHVAVHFRWLARTTRSYLRRVTGVRANMEQSKRRRPADEE